MNLRAKLADYHRKNLISFHTPGHKGRADLLSAARFPADDLTELPGLDMLHAPEGVILEAERRAAEVFGAERTYFLVNGGTCGNQAIFTALAASGRQGFVLTDRRAHRSVAAGFVLSGLRPRYLSAVTHPDFGLPLGCAEPAAADLTDLIALHVTSPSYYGTVMDIASLSERRAAEGEDWLLCVDAAHGAHFFGDDFPPSPLREGADVTLHSAHKTLSALTQSAFLHARGAGARSLPLASALELLQTSSPSYLLLASMEAAVEQAARAVWPEGLREETLALQAALGDDLRLLRDGDIGKYGIKGLDWSKILVNLRPLDIGAAEAAEWLRTREGVEPELWDGENILFMLGIGNRPEDVRLLRRALENLVLQVRRGALPRLTSARRLPLTPWPSPPPARMTPREAWLAPKRFTPLKEAAGHIAGETVSVYPPGIPLIMAGEEITPAIGELWRDLADCRWQGWSGRAAGAVLIAD
ncbi:MAG: amino acid decarboxylase [Gracilibacteraceae bacterium]|jgi:arginine/lysine/ornithine decarboxylase|nr:amino acid decarboxylase [Gracilibacteraceae bacterium]